jgi:hypothetical protein
VLKCSLSVEAENVGPAVMVEVDGSPSAAMAAGRMQVQAHDQNGKA